MQILELLSLKYFPEVEVSHFSFVQTFSYDYFGSLELTFVDEGWAGELPFFH